MSRQSFQLDQITLAVLAGGEGSRMGRPKGELKLNGRPILEDLLERFAWPGPTLLVTSPGRERPPGSQRFDNEVADPIPAAGPFRGLMTALEVVTTPLLAVVTVDMPHIGPEQIAWLAQHLANEPLLGVMCTRQADDADQIEPFPLLIRASARDWVAGLMAAGIRSTYRLSQTDLVKAMLAPRQWPATTWMNLNRPEDLTAFEMMR